MAIINKPDMTNLWASGGAVIAPSGSKVQTGWTAEIPPHQWENWVQNRQDEAIAYLFQRGVAEWDATTEYSANESYVQWNGKTYKAIANSINVPPSNTSSWKVWGLELDDLPSATTTTQGVIEIATNAETITGTDTARAVTPAGLTSRTALESRTGLVQLATTAEAQALTDDTRAITPKKLVDSGAVFPGEVRTFAGAVANVPDGWLPCNGAAISRTTYARLFNVIGTTYGNGNGSTTFNLPDLRGEFIRGLDNGRGVDAGRALGSAQGDELKSHTHAGTWTARLNGQSGSGVSVIQDGASTHATGGPETRPRNIAMNYIIKY